MILGAVLAGGASRRFGRDKAAAVFRGLPLIAHAVTLLERLTADVVVVGGQRAGYPTIPDRPVAGLGPLGGVCGAMIEARARGFDAVLSVPCDTPTLAAEALAALLAAGAPAYLATLPVAGLWPARDADALLAHLSAGGERSMRGWAQACGATGVETGAVANINRVEDLRDAERDSGLAKPVSSAPHPRYP